MGQLYRAIDLHNYKLKWVHVVSMGLGSISDMLCGSLFIHQGLGCGHVLGQLSQGSVGNLCAYFQKKPYLNLESLTSRELGNLV